MQTITASGRVPMDSIALSKRGHLPQDSQGGITFDALHFAVPTNDESGRTNFASSVAGQGLPQLSNYGLWTEEDGDLSLLIRVSRLLERCFFDIEEDLIRPDSLFRKAIWRDRRMAFCL